MNRSADCLLAFSRLVQEFASPSVFRWPGHSPLRELLACGPAVLELVHGRLVGLHGGHVEQGRLVVSLFHASYCMGTMREGRPGFQVPFRFPFSCLLLSDGGRWETSAFVLGKDEENWNVSDGATPINHVLEVVNLN